MSSPALSDHVYCISEMCFSLVLYSYCSRYAITSVGWLRPCLRLQRGGTAETGQQFIMTCAIDSFEAARAFKILYSTLDPSLVPNMSNKLAKDMAVL